MSHNVLSLQNNWQHMSKEDRHAAVKWMVDTEGWSRTALATVLGLHHSAIARLYPRRKRPNAVIGRGNSLATPDDSGSETETQTIDNSSNTRTIELKNTPINSVEDLLKRFNVDQSEWEVERFTVNRWEGMAAQKATSSELTSKNGKKYTGWTRETAKIIVQPLYQVKAVLKRKTLVISARNEISAMMADLRAKAPHYKPVRTKASAIHKIPGNLLEINIPDHHMGKLAWGEETLHGNYDTAIAEQAFRNALSYLISATSVFSFDKVVFVIGNDAMQADNLAGTTTSGTYVDTDNRFQKVFRATRRLYVDAVERLREIAPVEIKMVPGNHDTLTAWMLGEMLSCQFSNCEDVVVDNSPALRKYLQFGDVMLMYTHGNKGKLSQYPQVMAAEMPAMWGATKFREVHTGDKHHTRLDEFKGVKVRILPALCPPDAWHSENLFIGSLRSAEAYVFNASAGLVQISVYNVPGETAGKA